MKFTEKLMRQALEALSRKLEAPVHLVVGGGGAMLLAHHFPFTTSDIDAVPKAGATLSELEPWIREVAQELNLPADWLNPHFSTFAHVLPSDFGNRLIEVGRWGQLTVSALSREDLMIMKCFAGRQKDVVHARALYKKGIDESIVLDQIKFLEKKHIPGTEKARKFFEEIEEFFGNED